jgi:hypothetical protein
LIQKRLADRIALVIVPADGKNEQLGLKIGQPGSAFRQKDLPRFKLGRGDRHATRLVALRLNGEDSRLLAVQLLNEGRPCASIFDQDTSWSPKCGLR